MKTISFKDFHGRVVNVGDKVTLLKKVYGFCSISRAYLFDAVYVGKSRWGFEFDYPDRPRHCPPIRIKKPQCILYKKKGGK